MSGSATLWIARREWREFLRDRRLAVLGAFVLALTLCALVLGALEQQRFVENRSAAVAQDRAIWQGQGKVNPHTAAHFGMFAFRPRASLTAFDPGLAPWMGEAVWIEAHYQNPAQGRSAEAGTTIQRFGDLSAAWMLQVLLPLLIVLAGYGSVAGERERGALKLQLVQGASAIRLLVGKTLALGGLGMMVVLPMFILAGLAAALMAPDGVDMALRWAMLLAAYTCYAVVWALVTIAISTWAGTARKALIMLLAFWALTIVLLPRLAADAGAHLHPMQSAGDFWEAASEAREQGINGHDPSAERTKALRAAVMRQYGVTRMQDLPIDFAGIALQAGEDYGNQVFDRMFGDLAQAEEGQQDVALGFSPLTPVVALRLLSAGLSGNDLVHQQAFTIAAEAHRRKVQRLLNDEQTAHGKGQNFNNTVEPDFWRQIPTFDWQPPEIGAVVGRYAAPALVLLAWLMVAAGLLVLSARRLEACA